MQAIFNTRSPVRTLIAATLAALRTSAIASSHREAPMITQMPKLDGTDVYAFRSYEPGRADFVTIIANYQPLQDPFGGPNYFYMDHDAVYEIHIDNNGDGREDLTFQFKFKYNLKNTTLSVGGKNVAIPLVNSGQITEVNPGSSGSGCAVRWPGRGGVEPAPSAASSRLLIPSMHSRR